MPPSLIRQHLPIYSLYTALLAEKQYGFSYNFFSCCLMQLSFWIFPRTTNLSSSPHFWIVICDSLSGHNTSAGETMWSRTMCILVGSPDFSIRPSIIYFFFRNKYGSVCVHECVHMCEEEIAWRKTQTCRVVLVPLQMEDIQKESEGVVKIFWCSEIFLPMDRVARECMWDSPPAAGGITWFSLCAEYWGREKDDFLWSIYNISMQV